MARIKRLMRRPVLYDGRNIYDPQTMFELGFIYRGVGRGYPPPEDPNPPGLTWDKAGAQG